MIIWSSLGYTLNMLNRDIFLILTILFFLAANNTCKGFLEIFPVALSYLAQKIPCYGTSCCTDKQIPANFQALKDRINNEVFGQPIVKATVSKALKWHWNPSNVATKALTLSFHGGTGTGKNFVADIIAETMYAHGFRSPHVHRFFGRIHFPEQREVQRYKENLSRWIKGNVSNCAKQMFIFDEVNHIPNGVLDVLKPFIDYSSHIDGVDYGQAVFIFLSNTGTQLINELIYDYVKRGIKKDDLRLSDFDSILSRGSYNEKGGFQFSETIKSTLIDHFVPFLPLTKKEVLQCIITEFRKRGREPTAEQMRESIASLEWGPGNEQVFAKSGCKRISQKVAVLIDD